MKEQKRRNTMGFAKYFEDDLEIMEERQYWTQTTETAPTLLISEKVVAIMDAMVVETMKQPIKTKAKRKTRKLVCSECGTSFLFTGGEQCFYEKRNLLPPSRCPSCRDKRKAFYKEINTQKEIAI